MATKIMMHRAHNFYFKNKKERSQEIPGRALRKRLLLVVCTMKFWKSTNKDEIQFDFEDKIWVITMTL
jgi:hypothetical protein